MVTTLNDYELLYMINQKDETALNLLLEKYRRIISKMILSAQTRYRPKGLEREDLFQECFIAVVEAALLYREDYQAPFFSFVKICIDRQIKNYTRRFNSHEARRYYNSPSLDMYISEDENLYLYDIIAENPNDISYFTRFNNQLDELVAIDNQLLTELEKQVLLMKIQGYSYQEISAKLNISGKRVDNCIQRVRHKTQRYYN